jgi:predicted transcriptional regulator of viral defense system
MAVVHRRVREEIVMDIQQWASRRSVVTLDELDAWLDREYSHNKRSRETLLAYHVRQGHFRRVRRGLFATVPPGVDPQAAPVDPYLIAARSADDAVLAYHTALELHGRAHSVFQTYYFQSRRAIRSMTFQGGRFECLTFSKALRRRRAEHFGTVHVERLGQEVRVAGLERTLVDVCDRPDLAGGWEELWRSLETIEYFDLDVVMQYVRLLGNRTTAAKVGYYLQQHTEALGVDDRYLKRLERLCPRQPHYLERGKAGKFVRRWNLVIPPSLAEQSWTQVL